MIEIEEVEDVGIEGIGMKVKMKVEVGTEVEVEVEEEGIEDPEDKIF
jgi:hypothetical protein